MKSVGKHIILTSGRSGSNYFANLLNSHPQVLNYGEILGDWTLPKKIIHPFFCLRQAPSQSDYFNFFFTNRILFELSNLYTMLSVKRSRKIKHKKHSEMKSIGVKDFFINFKKIDYFLSEFNDLKVIYLYRKNLFHKYISLLFMNEFGIVKNTSNKEFSGKIKVNVTNMLKGLEILKSEKEYEIFFLKKIKKNPVMTICYEEYFRNDETSLVINDDICSFLEVEQIGMMSSNNKVLSKRYDNLIINFDEVEDSLKGTSFEEYLNFS